MYMTFNKRQELFTLREYSSSPPAVGGVCVCHHFSFVFVFVMCLLNPMLPVSLDCLFLAASAIFSNVHKMQYFYKMTPTQS